MVMEERLPSKGIVTAPEVKADSVGMDVDAVERKRPELQNKKLFHLDF